MRFAVHDELSAEETERGLDLVVRDGVATQVMSTLTGGAFLVALALALGASPAVVGLMAAVVPLAQVSQLGGIWIVERFRVRRAIVVVAAALSRSLWLLVAVAPLVFPANLALLALVAALTLHFVVGGLAATGWNSWMRDIIPQDRLGTFFSKRLALMTAVSVPLYLLAAFFLDWWPTFRPDVPLGGFSVLFTLGFLAGIIGVGFLFRTPEPRMLPREGSIRIRETLREPLRDANFRKLIIFFAAWGFAVNLAAPFFTVYLIQRLGYPMTWVVGLFVISQIVYVFFIRLWGRYADRFSNKSVLGICGPLFFLSVLAWTFTTLPEPHAYTPHLLVVIHIMIGISTAGTTLATGNIALKLAPRGSATSYLATNSLVHAVAAGAAPIIGGLTATYFAGRSLTLNLQWSSPIREVTLPTFSLSQWDFFFGFAFLAGLYALHRLSMVDEQGHVEEKVVLSHLTSEMVQGMRNLSTAAGVRNMIAFPIGRLREVPLAMRKRVPLRRHVQRAKQG